MIFSKIHHDRIHLLVQAVPHVAFLCHLYYGSWCKYNVSLTWKHLIKSKTKEKKLIS